MIKRLKNKWRQLHISKDIIRIGSYYRFNKRKLQLLSIKGRVPNLIVVGSQKCGTTSLFYYLNYHPEICLTSPFKESGYFMFDKWAKDYWLRIKQLNIRSKNELLYKYMGKNLTDEHYYCDASTYYTQDLNEQKYSIPETILSESEDARILYIIRNPFERLTSVYYHLKRTGSKKDINDILDDWIINTTLYYDRIKPYIDINGKQNVYVIQMEHLKKEPQVVMSDVFRFLGLNTVNIPGFEVHNKTSPKNKDKFSQETYNKLKPMFLRQKQLLESNFKLYIDWNLDENNWVKKN